MKKQIAIALFFSLSVNGYAQSQLESKILRLLPKHTKASIIAVSLPDGNTIASINPTQALNPASLVKLITTAAALKKLGPDYQFPTRFYVDDGAYLYIKGFGDPKLVIERLEEIMHELAGRLPKRINDIVVDDSFFGDEGFPGMSPGSMRAYDAMPSAVALNHAAITVKVSPGPRAGGPAVVSLDAPGFEVVNQTKTILRKGRAWVSVKQKGDKLYVTGRVRGERTIFLKASDPAGHIGLVVKSLLLREGIEVIGGVRRGIVPKNVRLILEARSPVLADILKDMNKHSNNFIAETVLKVLGAHVYGEPATTEKGLMAVRDYLAGLGIADYRLENGSGLSYNNRISAAGLLRVMEDIYSEQKLRDIYIDSLSIMGVDGTLKKWRGQPGLVGNFRGKTGTLYGVSGLAGFVNGGNGKMVALVAMLEGPRINPWKGREVLAKIAARLGGY